MRISTQCLVIYMYPWKKNSSIPVRCFAVHGWATFRVKAEWTSVLYANFFPVGDIFDLSPSNQWSGDSPSYLFSKSVVIAHHVREHQTFLTCYCGNVCGCMADVWRHSFDVNGFFLTFTCFYEFVSSSILDRYCQNLTDKTSKLTHLKIIFNKFRKIMLLRSMIADMRFLWKHYIRVLFAKNKGKNKHLLWITWRSGILLSTHYKCRGYKRWPRILPLSTVVLVKSL